MDLFERTGRGKRGRVAAAGLALALAGVCAVASGGGSGDWWNAAWSRRVRLTFDAGPAVGLTDLPVRVSLATGRVDPARGGADLRFIGADGGELAYEVDECSAAGCEVWLKLPSVPAAPVWLYFGNPDAPAGARPSEVWSNGYAGVWHLAPGAEGKDSAGQGGQVELLGSPASVAGVIGSAMGLDGVDDFARSPDAGTFDALPALTAEAWIKPGKPLAQMPQYARVVEKWRGSNGGWGLFFGSANDRVGLNVTAPDGGYNAAYAMVTPAVGAWLHVAGSWAPEPGDVVVYLDGVEKFRERSNAASLKPSIHAFRFGGNDDNVPPNHFTGAIDEVRVSSVARTPEWIAAEQRSMAGEAVTFGEVEVYGEQAAAQPKRWNVGCGCGAATR